MTTEDNLSIICPKCEKADLIMKEVFHMSWFGCPNCNAVFYNNGWDLVEAKND